jgi:hypothetical protein
MSGNGKQCLNNPVSYLENVLATDNIVQSILWKQPRMHRNYYLAKIARPVHL